MTSTWEDMVSLNPGRDDYVTPVQPAAHYLGEKLQPRLQIPHAEEVLRDPYPLPATKGREGYYGEFHLNYWMSGLKDSQELIRLYHEAAGRKPEFYLDFGGASGRVARHMLLQHDVSDVWIADINRQHVTFTLDTFEGRIKAFQSTSLPHLPFEDNSLDLVSAFSVFSHIETFDETWLLELRRVLRPGGLIIATANIDTFQDINESWPVYKALANHPEFDKARFGKPLSENRLVVRWKAGGSYTSVVYLKSRYVETRWKPFFSKCRIIPYLTMYQSGVILQK